MIYSEAVAELSNTSAPPPRPVSPKMAPLEQTTLSSTASMSESAKANISSLRSAATEISSKKSNKEAMMTASTEGQVKEAATKGSTKSVNSQAAPGGFPPTPPERSSSKSRLMRRGSSTASTPKLQRK